MRSRSRFTVWFTVMYASAAFVFMSPGLCQTTKSRQSPRPHNVYIARFTSSDLVEPKLLASFRDLFEESFEQLLAGDGGVYKVLNRETIDKVLGQAQDEAKLTSVEQLDATLKGRLKIENAEGFVFGKVIDDKESGEIIISAKLQSFDSILHWNKSVTMKRGLLNSRADRKNAMEQLAGSIGETSYANSSVEHRDIPDVTNLSAKLISDKLRLCEEPVPNPMLMGDCGVLTWNGVQYNAVWEGWTLLSERDFPQQTGKITVPGTIKVERDGERGVTLRRFDTTGISCIYHGELSGAKVASGTYVCEFQGKTVTSGPWKVIPKS